MARGFQGWREAAGHAAHALDKAVRATGRALAIVGHAVFGAWTPPAWITAVGRGAGVVGVPAAAWLRRHALAAVVLLLLAAAALWQAPHVATRCRSWAPAWMNVGLVPDNQGVAAVTFGVTPPGVRDLETNESPRPLLVAFSAPAAPVLRIGHEALDVAIAPAIPGRWVWMSTTQLAFAPKDDWPLGQSDTVTFGPKALAAHVEMKEREFEFTSPRFTVKMARPEFYQDPVQPTLRRVIVQVAFSHPVDAASFESRVHLDDGSARKFSVSYDKFKKATTLQSEPLQIPAETMAMQIRLDAGIAANAAAAAPRTRSCRPSTCRACTAWPSTRCPPTSSATTTATRNTCCT